MASTSLIDLSRRRYLITGAASGIGKATSLLLSQMGAELLLVDIRGVRTALTKHIYQDKNLINRIKEAYPLGLGETSDIYNAVNFLLSDEAR